MLIHQRKCFSWFQLLPLARRVMERKDDESLFAEERQFWSSLCRCDEVVSLEHAAVLMAYENDRSYCAKGLSVLLSSGPFRQSLLFTVKNGWSLPGMHPVAAALFLLRCGVWRCRTPVSNDLCFPSDMVQAWLIFVQKGCIYERCVLEAVLRVADADMMKRVHAQYGKDAHYQEMVMEILDN